MTDKNKFPMPMIKSPEFAAEKNIYWLNKKKCFRNTFSKTFYDNDEIAKNYA